MLSIVGDHAVGTCEGFRRREFLRIGSLALGGLGLPGLLSASRLTAAEGKSIFRDRSVVFLFLQGGPPQIETFDPKPEAVEGIRSITGDVATALPGVRIGGNFPKLAERAERLAIVRSFGAGKGGLSHEAGYEKILTADNTFQAPLGALYARAAGSLNPRTGLPTNALLLPEAIDPNLKLGQPSGAFTLPQTLRYFGTAGKLGASAQPFTPGGGGELFKNLELRMEREQFDDRRRLLGAIDSLQRKVEGTRDLEGAGVFQQQAYDVLLRGIGQAFDLSREDAATLARYDTSHLVRMADIHRGGRKFRNNFSRSTNLLGKQMLLARRLCEAGCGFVTVVDSCWDFHDDGNNPPVDVGMNTLAPQLDHAVSAFLDDVAERGLSDKILLVITAEMGRTPRKGGKSGAGSGHWGDLTPLVLAGGGLKMGQVIGASDRTGGYPAGDPYTPRHLLGTVFHSLFDVGEARVAFHLPRELVQLISESPTIPELV